MKAIFFIIISVFAFACKKKYDVPEFATTPVKATVLGQNYCHVTDWLVVVENPDPSKQSFMCPDNFGSAFSCGSAVVITNMPASLQQIGKKIKFTGWAINETCFSSDMAPRVITAANITEQ